MATPWVAKVHRRAHYGGAHGFYSPNCCTVSLSELTDSDLIEIYCKSCETYFDKFVVRLEADGPVYLQVNQTFTDGDVGEVWKKWGNEIDVVGTHKNLRDYGYAVADVFSAPNNSWSSTMVSVYPVYP